MADEIWDRRTWIATIRRFAELTAVRHGPTRYASIALVPLAVAFVVPGLWWAACLGCGIVGVVADRWIQGYLNRFAAEADNLDDATIRKRVRFELIACGVVTAIYTAPYALLAFSPAPGPFIGFIFCAGAAVVCCSLHVMTRNMVYYTAPVFFVGMVANAYMTSDGVTAIVLAAGALALGANTIVAARCGAKSLADLTGAQLRAEESAAQLELRVKERTEQLAVASARANAANHAKSMFLANMSHELRTPLNAVIGYAEIVQEDMESGDTGTSVDDLAKIKSAATHLLSLINEVLDLSRIESGKLHLANAPFDLIALVQSAVDTVKPAAAQNGTLCSVQFAPELGDIVADETRVRQCVLNLLSNAVKFTKNGVVALDLRSCRIRGAAGVAITVRDTGPGISAEDQTRLFNPFVQVDGSHTRTHEGAGLGLVITRQLARAMGGEVRLVSELGQGSRFTLYLPLDWKASVGSAAA